MSYIRLESLYLDNFKSFKKSKFEFGKVNCLIAPNNTGKSNLIFALTFLNDILYNGMIPAISKLDLKNIKNYHYSESLIEINAKFKIENDVLSGNTLIKYMNDLSITFKIDLETQFYNFDVEINGKLKHINVDKFDLLNNLGYFDLKVYNNMIEHNLRDYDKYMYNLNQNKFTSFKLNYSLNTNNCTIESNNKTKNIINKLYGLVFANEQLVSVFDFKNIFNNFQLFAYFYFDINQIKKPELTGNVAAFLPNGKNLIEVLDFLNKNNHDIFESISLSLIGEIEAITGLEIDNSTFMPSLKFKEEIGNKQRDIDIWNISDGTIHFIAIITAILSYNKSIGIMIEEPERHMHMKVLLYILNSMRDSESQIFFTTHSTEMLSELELDEIIFMFRNFDGDTKGIRAKNIKNIEKIMDRYDKDLVSIIQMGILDNLEDEL